MNFKTKSLIVFLIISVFLLSSCEVYQTLYPKETGAKQESNEPKLGEVYRVEANEAKDYQENEIYATTKTTMHDPFKQNPDSLGPFEKGESLGMKLKDWSAASGEGNYSLSGGNAQLKMTMSGLVPDGVYSVICSRFTLPPAFTYNHKPCGAENGSESSFIADENGNAEFNLKLKPLNETKDGEMNLIAVVYHSDKETHQAEIGDFGVNAHIQLAFPFALEDPTKKFEMPFTLASHDKQGLPEQDVFVDKAEKTKNEITGEAVTPAPSTEPKEEAPAEEKAEERPPIIVTDSGSKPIVVEVEETELVDLETKANDPDKETVLTFTFTSPLDDNGKWQTIYGDNGEYTVTVTASDGELATAQDVLVIVHKKEESPTIDVAKPIETGLSMNENEETEFSAQASDLNKDPLTFTWKLDGIETHTGDAYTLRTTFDDAGTHTVKVDISDGTGLVSKIWSIDVKNVNRVPIVEAISDITVKETEPVNINVAANDEDKDSLTYSISDKRFTQDGSSFTWQTDYDAAGDYEITISVNDGQDTTTEAFNVHVDNVNRAPVITEIIQKK